MVLWDNLSFCYYFVEYVFVELDKNKTGHAENAVLVVMCSFPNQDVEQFVDSLIFTMNKIIHGNKKCYIVTSIWMYSTMSPFPVLTNF